LDLISFNSKRKGWATPQKPWTWMQKGKESGRKGWLGLRKHVHGCKMKGKVDDPNRKSMECGKSGKPRKNTC
jgi:hypothetical protein